MIVMKEITHSSEWNEVTRKVITAIQVSNTHQKCQQHIRRV